MRFPAFRIVVAAVVLLGIGVVVFGGFSVAEVRAKIAWFGVWAPVVYVIVYAVLGSIFFPASVLTLAAGAAFGLGLGTLVCSLGATLGAALSFLIGRYLARDWVAMKLQGSRRFLAIDRAVAREGWRVVALTRLSPIFPYGLLNYGFGITAVRFWPYVLSSWITMVPGTVLYVYIGTLGRSLAEVSERGAWEWALFCGGLLATVVVVMLVTRAARRAMQVILCESEGPKRDPGPHELSGEDGSVGGQDG